MALNIEHEVAGDKFTIKTRISVPVPGDVNDQGTLKNFTNQLHNLTTKNTASAAWRLDNGQVLIQRAGNVGAQGAVAPHGMINIHIVQARQAPYQRFDLTMHHNSTFRAVKEALGFDVDEWDGWVLMGAWLWLTDNSTLAQMHVGDGTFVYLCARRDRYALRAHMGV